VRDRIGHDIGKKDVFRRAEIVAKKSRQRNHNPRFRQVMGQVDVHVGPRQSGPGLIDPALGTGDFSLLFERGDLTSLPSFLLGGIR
jgi:hypothetical protein